MPRPGLHVALEHPSEPLPVAARQLLLPNTGRQLVLQQLHLEGRHAQPVQVHQLEGEGRRGGLRRRLLPPAGGRVLQRLPGRRPLERAPAQPLLLLLLAHRPQHILRALLQATCTPGEGRLR